MTTTKKADKTASLDKYYELIVSVLDYNIDNKIKPMIDIYDESTIKEDPTYHWNLLKSHAFEYYMQNKLNKLKEMFSIVTGPFISTMDLSFNEYLKNKTGYKVDILKDYFKRMDKLITEGEISNEHHYCGSSNFVRNLNQQGIKDKRSKILT